MTNPDKNLFREMAFLDPESHLRHLRTLLKNGNDLNLPRIYEEFGFTYLVLGEHQLARIFYLETLKLIPDHIYALANIAHAAYELGNHDEAIDYGRRALQLKSDLVSGIEILNSQPANGTTKTLFHLACMEPRRNTVKWQSSIAHKPNVFSRNSCAVTIYQVTFPYPSSKD